MDDRHVPGDRPEDEDEDGSWSDSKEMDDDDHGSWEKHKDNWENEKQEWLDRKSDEMDSGSHGRHGVEHLSGSHSSEESHSHEGIGESKDGMDYRALPFAAAFGGFLILVIFVVAIVYVCVRKRRATRSHYNVMENEKAPNEKKYLPDIYVEVPPLSMDSGLEKGSVMPKEKGGSFYMIAADKSIGIENPMFSTPIIKQ